MRHATKYGFQLAAVLLAAGLAGCLRRAGPDPNAINFAHLQHLQEKMVVNGTPCLVVHIYSQAPDYQWVSDEDEGAACVDDAARAVRLYLRHFERTGDASVLVPAKGLLRFVMAMQADDGRFYNFVFDNGTINREHVNSRKSLGWWAARGFHALAVGRRVWPEVDTAMVAKLDTHARATVARLIQVYEDTAAYGPLGEDVASVWALGLLEWRAATGETEVDSLIVGFEKRILRGVQPPGENFPYLLHLCWRNLWHGWGALQVEALARGGKELNQPEWLRSARAEAEGFQRWLIADGLLASLKFEDGDTVNVKRFPQIAYGANSLVACQAAMFDVTGDSGYAAGAGLAARWFTGDNPAGERVYDGRSGRGYDGVEASKWINLNSGAESTIESLLAMETVHRLPVALEALRTVRAEGATEDSVAFTTKNLTLQIKRNGGRWILLREHLKP